MKTKIVLIQLIVFSTISVYSQHDTAYGKHDIYRLNGWVDVPITTVGATWSVYCLTKVYIKGPSTEQQILSLNENNINPVDRKLANFKYNKAVDNASYIPFYASFPYPLIFIATGRNMRQDYWKLSALYLETMAVTGLFGFSGTYFVNKYRPYAYDSANDMSLRTSQNAKNSFYCGHCEVVAASTFFAAKVYSDYYPDSKNKWLFYTIAGVVTLGTAGMRYEAAEHFPSDLILGVGMGAATGILVPQFHKHRLLKNPDMSLIPCISPNSIGFAFNYN